MRTGLVYAFFDELEPPFYIGVTVNIKNRNRYHKLQVKNGNPLPKYNKMRKVLKIEEKDFSEKVRIIEENIPIEKLFEKEIFYIKKFKEDGYTLYNLTDGGDGCLNPAKESRIKMSLAHIGKKRTDESKKKMSLIRIGMKFSDEHKKNLSIARKKRKITADTILKISKSSKGKVNIKKYRIIDQFGTIHDTENGLTNFCEKNGLKASNLYKTLIGKRKHHRGWRILERLSD